LFNKEPAMTIARKKIGVSVQDREHGLLAEISGLANLVRCLRADAVTNQEQIKVLSGDLRAKWDEMRALRAPLVNGDVSLRRRGHYD
jgi:hypothetical protein